ncbi:MAG: flagellar export chaperone FliS [Nitrospinae bacterium]|nr:flagellar export chaperone FliS [Nitrospinota bacterium]
MVPNNYYNEYRRNQISTSSQGKLILMMYDGAIQFAGMAAKALEAEDLPKKGKYIQKTHDIINELSCSLDVKKGGDVAVKLENLYQFILNQLVLANIKSDRKALDSTIRILTLLREAWETIINKTTTPAGSPAPHPGAQAPQGITAKC